MANKTDAKPDQAAADPAAAATAAVAASTPVQPDPANEVTLVKGEHEITTSLPSEAVQLRAAGWRDKTAKKGTRR